MNVVEMARVFATAAHAAVEQTRKYSGDPYIVHPAAVAKLVTEYGGDDNMIAAAWLHDVVEDTGVTIETVESVFGADVAELVGWLTDVSKPEDGNRKTRKEIDRQHTAQAPGRAQTIKCCDLIDNSKTIVPHDPSFARVYLREKVAILEGMTKAWQQPYADAWSSARNGQKLLAMMENQ